MHIFTPSFLPSFLDYFADQGIRLKTDTWTSNELSRLPSAAPDEQCSHIPVSNLHGVFRVHQSSLVGTRAYCRLLSSHHSVPLSELALLLVFVIIGFNRRCLSALSQSPTWRTWVFLLLDDGGISANELHLPGFEIRVFLSQVI